MLNDKTKKQIEKLHSQWQQEANKSKTLNKKFITVSGEEMNPLYTPLDLEGIDFERDINFPGASP
jgi:methylmalonyl-CoA mutase N-terminal domain/subunit